MSRFLVSARFLLPILLLSAGLSPLWAAVEQHEHNITRNESGLTLNNGKPWPTDAALRKGMEAIQRDIREVLPRIRNGSFSARQYSAVAKKILNHIHHVTKNCKLPPDADAQLHRVLAELMHGTETMQAQTGQASGAAMIVHALDLYGRHFDHTGWEPLAH